MMVDFNPDKIYRYIPKNLSYEERYERYYSDNAFLQALQLCDCKGDSRQFDKCVKKSFAQFLHRVGYKVKPRSETAGAEASNSSPSKHRSSRKPASSPTADKASDRKNIVNAKLSSATRDVCCAITSPTLVGTFAWHEISSSSLCALDLASSLGTTTKSSTAGSQFITKSNGETAEMETVGIISSLADDDTEKTLSLGCEESGTLGYRTRVDPSLTVPLLQAGDNLNQTELLSDVKLDIQSDESGTNFSEDYMQMTDVSDLDAPASIGSYSFDSESGSTQAFSENSELSVFEDSIDLERVTINFDNMAVHENDTNYIDYTGEKEVDLYRSEVSNVSSTGLVNKTRCKERDLTKIKILLGQKPDVNDVPNSDSDDSPVLKSTPRTGTLFDTSQEFDFLQETPVKRSTSLKTYKTPPGTPHRKKEVRFADALGLDLEDVRHVMNADDPPKIPDSAMKDLRVGLEEEHKTEGTKYLSVCFSQPGASPVFVQKVMDSKVKLENCLVDGQEMTISGTIRVANVGYHKRVVVRFTVNDWKTFTDVFATYVQNSNDGATDRFSFTIGVPKYFQTGDKTQFAVMYESNGQEFWDNNGGRNYIVECYATAVPVRESDNLWMHFL